MSRRHWPAGLLLLLLLCVASPSLALGPADGTGITVYGGDRLSQSAGATLRGLLTQMPVSLYPHLSRISVDNATMPSGESCEGFLGPCGMNIYSSGESVTEDPFPTDAPLRAASSVFYAVAAHELGHQVSLWAIRHRGGWDYDLPKEAGCEPMHYLRSMLPVCYCRDNPQEFVASMVNQWAICSECALRLALARWDAGIGYPLSHAVYLMWLFGSRPDGDPEARAGQVLAYREHNGQPEVTIWTVRPWRCGGDVTIAAPTWTLTLALNAACRVDAVVARDGI